MITNHNRLNRHENLVDPSVNPICRFCGEEEETAFHLIGMCDRYLNQRRHIFTVFNLDNPPTWKPHLLLQFLAQSRMAELNTREPQEPSPSQTA